MTRRIVLLAGFALLLGNAPAFPTTVVPPTFEELVDRANTIFVGETVSRRSQRLENRDGPLIVTLVTFNVVETLKGAPGLQMTLEFMGGTVDDVTLVVSGMPQFNVGDKDVVFVGNATNAVSPLVGFAHGRFRISKDDRTGRESVRTYDGRNFAGTAALGSVDRGFPRADTLSLSTFKNDIVQRVRAVASRGAR
jgi:hypothetical protein